MWQLEGTSAQVKLENLTLNVSLEQSKRKLIVQSSDGSPMATLWHMPLVGGQPLLESYTRGNDLVCMLGPSQDFPFSTQLYWTLRTLENTPQPIVTVSLLISMRTDLLDTEPAVEIGSEIPHQTARTFDQADGPAFAVSLGEGLELLDFATPEDCRQQTMMAGSAGVSIDRTLFDHFLEKGVIRSGRLHAAVFGEGISAELAKAVCDELTASELPLTT